ncbi:MAG: helix-turn-helix transcriptional regulator [Pseudoalteromonas sp.]
MSLPSSMYYTTKEVAAMEGVTPGYLLEQVSQGKFMAPAHYGKPNRWLKATIDKYYKELNAQAIRLQA